jgi:hypothetical protein
MGMIARIAHACFGAVGMLLLIAVADNLCRWITEY